MLRTFELSKQTLDEHDPWRSFLSQVAWAIRSTYHATLEATPGQLVYGRDMILPIPFYPDWEQIRKRKQNMISKNMRKENDKRHPHKYRVGDKILLEKPGITKKMSAPRTGPHKVIKVYTNGTICIRRGAVMERVNIRRIPPTRNAPIREANAISLTNSFIETSFICEL